MKKAKIFPVLVRIWPELLLGLLLSLAYSIQIPLWQAPDEPSHFGNILFVRKQLLYPMTYGNSGLKGPFRGETVQPPLYYWVAAAITEPWVDHGDIDVKPVEDIACREDKWRIRPTKLTLWPFTIRCVSIALFLATLVLLGRVAQLIRPDEIHFPATAVAALIMVPQAVFMGSVISNDPAAMLMGTILFSQAVMLFYRSSPWYCLVMGITAVIGVATKFNLVPLYIASLIVVIIRFRHSTGKCITGFVLLLLPIISFVGAIALLKPALFSSIQFISEDRTIRLVAYRPLLAIPLSWESYWGLFGWMNVHVSPWIRSGFFTATIILAMGYIRGWRTRRGIHRFDYAALIFSGLAIMALFVDIRHSWQSQGRHVFPAIAPLSIIGAYGIRGFLSPRKARLAAYLLALAVNIYVLVVLLPSAYAQHPSDLSIGTSCCSGHRMTCELSSGEVERQVFVSSDSHLRRVGIVLATFGHPFRGEVRLTLNELHSGRKIAERYLNGDEIRDMAFHYLDFSPIRRSQGRLYEIEVELMPDYHGRIGVFCNDVDICGDTYRSTGEGDLKFVTYHSIGSES